jgi:D-alanyl-D-alanine carboxypeptidase
MKALATKSANDIAVALAEHIGGTEQRFAALMTPRARRTDHRRPEPVRAGALRPAHAPVC